MEFPAEMFVRKVEHSDDLFAFSFPFELEGKALTAEDATEQYAEYIIEDGDLIISGWAAEFDGNDRTGENFIDGAFQRGVKAFVDGQASLLFHHKKDQLLGKVLELEEVPNRGLRFLARVDGAIKNHPELGTIYAQIKKGSLKGLSVGGFFKRKLTADGRKICDMDMTEISITPVPTHSKPAFAVVAGKALQDDVTVDSHSVVDDIDVTDLGAVVDSLRGILDNYGEAHEGKAVKGDPQDLYFLALVLELEQLSNRLSSNDEAEETGAPETDKRVDALVVKVKDGLDAYAREAHQIASKLGPLPKISYASM